MIEREFINQKTKEFYIKKYIEDKLNRVGVSQIRLKKIPLGEKIIIHTSRPSLIVGSKGANIKDLTRALKKDFKLENPQVEIVEVKDIFLDASVVAERIVNSLERYGSARFKGVGHKIMENVMNSGAMGVELKISGKIPGSRAKSWRFYNGYLKKCGDIAVTGVRKSKKSALLKSGIVGIKVSIMPPDLVLPDHIEILEEPIQIIEEIIEEVKIPKKKTKKRVKKDTKPLKITGSAAPKEDSKKVSANEPEVVVETVVDVPTEGSEILVETPVEVSAEKENEPVSEEAVKEIKNDLSKVKSKTSDEQVLQVKEENKQE
jgi:small subunit ribosomal protein S3